jgi:hypothetical protein
MPIYALFKTPDRGLRLYEAFFINEFATFFERNAPRCQPSQHLSQIPHRGDSSRRNRPAAPTPKISLTLNMSRITPKNIKCR